MKKILLILLCLPMIGFGQGWEKTFGGLASDYGYSVEQTNDGGYIITGFTASFGNGDEDVYLIKTDANGIEQWNKTYGGTSIDFGNFVHQTIDGGYIIVGHSESYGNGREIYLIKTDANGIEQWNNTFGLTGYQMGLCVQQTSDGGFIISGTTALPDVAGPSDALLIKTDGNGTVQWSNTFGGVENEGSYSVQQTTDGGYIITGFTYSFGNGGADVYLLKTDGNGIEQWNKTFGGVNNDFSFCIKQTDDGGYIITGATESFGNGLRDLYLIKTDGNGIEQWTQTFGGIDFEEGRSILQTSDGGYIILGTTESFGNGQKDVYLVKTDDNGIEQWNKTYGGTNNEWGFSVDQTNDGGYIITGSTYTFGNGDSDTYLIKTDGSGNVTSTFNIPIIPNRKLEKTVDILGKQTKPKTNIPFIEIYDDGTVKKRIVIE